MDIVQPQPDDLIITLGDYVILGARVGLADHLTIGEGAQIGAAAGVMNDIPAGARWIGVPPS